MIDSHFLLGEDKNIKFLVKSVKDEVFSIREATYELFCDNDLETSGQCQISD